LTADLVEHETRQLGGASAGEGLPEGGRALVVGHSPRNEAAVSGLVGQTIAAMGKGEGVLVVETAAGMRCARSSDLVRSSSVSARPRARNCRATMPRATTNADESLDRVTGLRAGSARPRP
jgi:hypothetical protein